MEDDKIHDDRIHELLDRWQAGDRHALEELTPLVYRELHRLATNYMHGERKGHTLQATALVNEAFMRLGSRAMSFDNSSHFYGVAAKLMRHILVDHAKGKLTKKRGAGTHHDSAEEVQDQLTTSGGIDIAEIDDALTKLSQENSAAANAMELHYFAGMTTDETAAIMRVSVATVGRDLRFAKAWLMRELQSKAG